MENFKLPPGFRFHPTDEELVLQYLRRKVFSCPLPYFVIPELDISSYNPRDLFHDESEQEKYFFTLREVKYPNGSKINRSTMSGYWKATGKDKAVVASKYNKVVGVKKTLVFYKGKAPNGDRTHWIMHEYRLALPRSVNSMVAARSEWVLCRVFKKKRDANSNSEHEEEDKREENRRFIDFMGCNSTSYSTSSSESCVTNGADECSKNGDDFSSISGM